MSERPQQLTEEQFDGLADSANRRRHVQVTPYMLHVFDNDCTVAILYAFFEFATMRDARWVQFTNEQLVEETGLTLKQVKRARSVLLERGALQSRRRDKWNPTCEFKLTDSRSSREDPAGSARSVPQGDSHQHPEGSSHREKEELLEVDQEHTPPTPQAGGSGEILIGEIVGDPRTGNRSNGPQSRSNVGGYPSATPAPKTRETAAPAPPEAHPAAAPLTMRSGRTLKPSGDPVFDEFWTIAVKPRGTGAARTALTRAARKEQPEVILSAWREANDAWATWHPDQQQYIPMPATWLNQERWNDEQPEPYKGHDKYTQMMIRDKERAESTGRLIDGTPIRQQPDDTAFGALLQIAAEREAI